ncbi:hypothetical protein NDU88_004276 [Pleurodeles waltl]|uniref:Uncharacterized protein n=1 Tax=Pleurodeles waltl TaxID=8319 RepID=A0AAV7UFM9_PLEWA|nr:hypothetical protein NDU88_004276 [Pleurodeles waltl]
MSTLGVGSMCRCAAGPAYVARVEGLNKPEAPQRGISKKTRRVFLGWACKGATSWLLVVRMAGIVGDLVVAGSIHDWVTGREQELVLGAGRCLHRAEWCSAKR